VASAVGIAALGILGARAPEARPAARDLGIAMQLTNILRDVAQDAARGRVYIPLEDLRAHGIGPQDVLRRGVLPGPLVRFEAARARDFFRRGLRLLAHLPRRTRPVPAALAGVYRAVLDRIASAAEHPNGVELPAASRWRAAATSGLRALLGVP
jgi:phytoene synthase